jgi:hypothetical protein
VQSVTLPDESTFTSSLLAGNLKINELPDSVVTELATVAEILSTIQSADDLRYVKLKDATPKLLVCTEAGIAPPVEFSGVSCPSDFPAVGAGNAFDAGQIPIVLTVITDLTPSSPASNEPLAFASSEQYVDATVHATPVLKATGRALKVTVVATGLLLESVTCTE